MHAERTYDEGCHAGSGSGIKLKASEPLSPNAFVQIPVEAHQSQDVVNASMQRQKKMRVPRGGSVERPVQQRAPRRPARSVSLEEPVSGPLSPSLHVFLEPDPADEASVAEEQPESLAQFVASFPKIPTGLIFQPSAEEAVVEEEPLSDGEESSTDPFDEGLMTIRLDEGECPSPEPGHPLQAPVEPDPEPAARMPRSNPRITDRQRVSASDHLVPDGNPRFEKMIREARSRGAVAAAPQRAAANKGEGGRPQARMPRSAAGAAAQGGRRAPATSAPLGRQAAVSGPLPSRNGAAPFAPVNAQKQAAPFGRTSANPSNPSARSGPGANSAPLNAQGAPGHPGALSSGPNPHRAMPQRNVSPLRPAMAATTAFPRMSPAPAAAAPVSADALPTTGKPLLDPSAIEESTIFDEPPIPISEGMKDADKSHSKGRTFLIIGLVAAVVALVGVIAFFSTHGSITIPEISITTTDPNGSSASNGGGSTSGSPADADRAAPAADDGSTASGAGSVTYKYTAKTPGGVEYTVEESTTFDAQGNCTFTTMKMQFPTDSAAKDFTDSLARDLGSKYTLDALNGANATVTVDNSALGLNREDYENALRYSVDDLVILKK